MKTNQEILNERLKLFNKREGLRLGDFLKLSNGTYLRFCNVLDDTLQTTKAGSFYFGDGYVEFSGGICPPIDKKLLKQIDEKREGEVWFFDQGIVGPHRAVYFNIELRVFVLTDKKVEDEYIKAWVTRQRYECY
jgi:hypothetical protein